MIMETINENKIMVEVEKNKFLEMDTEKAIEFAVTEYFCNNRIIKLNNKDFDIMNYGNYRIKQQMA